MAAGYQTVPQFKNLTLLPGIFIEELEATQPGWTQAQLDYWSRWLDSQLRKRYAVPFVDPIPEVVAGWLTRIVSLRVLLRRGVDPTDAQFTEIKTDSDGARSEIREAATSGDNVYELPLRADLPGTSGVVYAAPLSYTEASPYVWTTVQRESARDEDQNGSGTRR